MLGMAWERCCWAGEEAACCCCSPPPWEGRASTVAMTGGAMDMWTSALGFTPAGLGDPAPLTPPSTRPVLGSLGIRFLRTQLPSLVGFLRRMLGLGEEASVGAPPTPWEWVCTMVAMGWVAPKVLPMGLATNVEPSARTTPEGLPSVWACCCCWPAIGAC